MRTFFQYATLPEFCEPVERITGRKVRSFQSSIDTKVDGLAIETFILYPDGEDGPSRIELAGAEVSTRGHLTLPGAPGSGGRVVRPDRARDLPRRAASTAPPFRCGPATDRIARQRCAANLNPRRRDI